MTDDAIVEAFHNFLSWGERPSRPDQPVVECRSVPPAWWAYAIGLTPWCPPRGEL